VAVLAVGGCGQLHHPTQVDGEGEYVDAGPITYQVQISRQLNPYSVEDKEYLNGASSTSLSKDQLWFGIFLWAKNQTGHNATTSDSFDIVDTEGTKYYPVHINSSVNPFAWTPQTLAPGATEPNPDAAAAFGPTQGELLLFRLNNAVYSNRPLTLQIYASGQNGPSTVSLDL
jgi:hypothetical protein